MYVDMYIYIYKQKFRGGGKEEAGLRKLSGKAKKEKVNGKKEVLCGGGKSGSEKRRKFDEKKKVEWENKKISEKKEVERIKRGSIYKIYICIYIYIYIGWRNRSSIDPIKCHTQKK